MKQTSSLLIALALSVLPAAAQLEILDDVVERLGGADIEAKNGIKFDKGLLVWDGGIHLKSDLMEAFADRAEFSVEREELIITGDVSIYKDGMLYRGERAVYSTKTNALDASGMRSTMEPKAPLWFTAQQMQSDLKDVNIVNAEGVDITTHDSENPNFFLRADKITIYPEDRVVFKHLKAYVGKTPVFYLPYLSQPLDEEQGYTFTPGYRSNLGAFLLNQYGDTIGDHSIIKYKLDGYSSRGVGAGLDLESRRFKNRPNFGKFKFYWVHDTNPQENGTGSDDLRQDIDTDRYRVNLQHRIYIPGPEESSLYVDIDLNKMSDQFFYEDFFPWEFREDPQPDNIINIIKTHDRGELSLLTRIHANDFYASDARLPEFAIDLVKQPVFDTGIFYAGNTSFGVLRDYIGEPNKKMLEERIEELESLVKAQADGTAGTLVDKKGRPITLESVSRGAAREGEKFDLEDANDLLSQLKSEVDDSKFNRFHTYHEFSYPAVVAEHFALTPKVGAGFTNYSSVSGPQPADASRALFSAGLDASFKFSRTFDDVKNPALGLDGLRHVVQPYVNWSFVSAGDNGPLFRGIDRLARSTQPRPLEVNNWTAIDSLNDWNVVRLGVYNRFQTKRNGGTYNWLQLNSFFDTFIDDPEFNRDFSNLYNEVEFQPVPWARLSFTSQLPVFGDELDFTEVNTRVTFMPTKNWEFTVGHRLLQDHPLFVDSDLIDFHTYYRINDNWGVSAYERYEIEDSTLELQQYSIHRDLSSWAMALGAVIRDHRGETEYGLVFSLTLKDFPGVRIPVDFDPSGGTGSNRR
ncbi:MAG: LPS assembly protein LptD [Verrucomicrobiales bacterium]|nr:LPS assembly protein LptD [Verrucomicrobiales bacterium]